LTADYENTSEEKEKLDSERRKLEAELSALVQEGWGAAQGDVWQSLRSLLRGMRHGMLEMCRKLGTETDRERRLAHEGHAVEVKTESKTSEEASKIIGSPNPNPNPNPNWRPPR